MLNIIYSHPQHFHVPFLKTMFANEPFNAAAVVPISDVTKDFEVVYAGDSVKWSRRGVTRNINDPQNFPRIDSNGVGIAVVTAPRKPRKTKAQKEAEAAAAGAAGKPEQAAERRVANIQRPQKVRAPRASSRAAASAPAVEGTTTIVIAAAAQPSTGKQSQTAASRRRKRSLSESDEDEDKGAARDTAGLYFHDFSSSDEDQDTNGMCVSFWHFDIH